MSFVFLTILLSQLEAATPNAEFLADLDRQFALDTAARRAEGWMDHMAPDIVLIRGQPIIGLEAVRRVIESDFASPTTSSSARSVSFKWVQVAGPVNSARTWGRSPSSGIPTRSRSRPKGGWVWTTRKSSWNASALCEIRARLQ